MTKYSKEARDKQVKDAFNWFHKTKDTSGSTRPGERPAWFYHHQPDVKEQFAGMPFTKEDAFKNKEKMKLRSAVTKNDDWEPVPDQKKIPKEKLDKIPKDIVKQLQMLATGSVSSSDNKKQNFDDINTAHTLLDNIPYEGSPIGGSQSGGYRDEIIDLVNNPTGKKSLYLSKNKALLQAFPILGHVYGLVGTDPEAEKKDVKQFADVYGKENVPVSYWDDMDDERIDSPDMSSLTEDTRYQYRDELERLKQDTSPQDLAYHQDATKWTPPTQRGWVPSEREEVRPESQEVRPEPQEVRPEPVDLDREPMHHEQREHARALRGDFEPYDPEAAAQRRREEERDDWSYMREGEKEFHKTGGFVGYANGGGVPVGEDEQQLMNTEMGLVGTLPEATSDQSEAAKNGEMGGDKVDKNLPEGSFVLNSYAVELAGIKDIEKLIKDAQRFYSDIQETEGIVQQPIEGDVEVRVSEGEYIIPPALVKIIGRDRLEKINKRGIAEFERQQAEVYEAEQQMSPEQQGFMPPEEAGMGAGAGAELMPQEGEVPPQGFALGGVATNPSIGSRMDQSFNPNQYLNTLQLALNSSPPAQSAMPNMNKSGENIVKQPNMRMANMGGFVPYSRHG